MDIFSLIGPATWLDDQEMKFLLDVSVTRMIRTEISSMENENTQIHII